MYLEYTAMWMFALISIVIFNSYLRFTVLTYIISSVLFLYRYRKVYSTRFYPSKGNTLLCLLLFIDVVENVLSPNELAVLAKWH